MTPAEIKAFRKSHGYTQAEFAAIIGLGDPSRISSIETGKRPISKQVEATVRWMMLAMAKNNSIA